MLREYLDWRAQVVKGHKNLDPTLDFSLRLEENHLILCFLINEMRGTDRAASFNNFRGWH